MGARSVAKLAFERADQVHDVAVALDEHQVLHANAAELADAADVVAAEIDEHDVLGDLFLVGAEIGFDGAVFDLVGAARARSGDGAVLDRAAVDADEQLRRGADDVRCRLGFDACRFRGRSAGSTCRARD